MKTIYVSAIIILLSAFTSSGILTGRWETRLSVNGNVTGVVFKADSSFEAYVNKKPFATGNYSLQDSIFSFTDNGCNGAKGVYVLHFFSNNDSLKLEVLSDSCEERKQGMTRLVLGKVKR